MDIKQYQKETQKTAIYPKERALEYLTLGIASEAGEVAGKIKKIIRDNQSIISQEKREEILSELGDCMWYISQICNELYSDLEDVLSQNISKLTDRQRRNALSGSGDNR